MGPKCFSLAFQTKLPPFSSSFTSHVGTTCPSSKPLYSTSNASSVRLSPITCTLHKTKLNADQEPIVIKHPSHYDKIPVHYRIPIIGFFIDFFLTKQRSPELARRYGPIFKTEFVGLPIYIITDMSLLSKVFKDSVTYKSAESYPANFRKMFGEKTMFILDGHDHVMKRSSVSSAFSSQLFPIYLKPMISLANQLWSTIESDLRAKRTVKLEPYIRDYYLRLIIHITTGNSDNTNLSFDEIQKNYQIFTRGLASPPFGPIWNSVSKSRRILLDGYIDLIKDRLLTSADKINRLRSYGEELGKHVKRDLKGGSLDILTVAIALSSLETGAGKKHDEGVLQEIAELVLLLWFAGSSTQVATTLSSLLTMGFDRDIWNRLVEEQDEIVSKHGKNDITIQQVNREMPLLDSFVTEILRVYPPAIGIFRKAHCDTSVMNYFIPKGSVVMLDLWGSQRNEQYYRDPDTVKLDRFLDKDGRSEPKPPSIVTFGAVGGSHFCIGFALARVAIKTTLATLLRHYEFELSPDQTRNFTPIPELRPSSQVVVKKLERKLVRDDDKVQSNFVNN